MYAPHIIRRRFHWPTAVIMLGIFVALAGVAVGLVIHSATQSPVPNSIKQQLNFPVFIPTIDVKLNQASYEFRPDQKVLIFSGSLVDGQQITFSEQSTPEPFNDIPNYMDQFLLTFFEYQSFDSLQGKVYLTHPKNDGQVAVMNAKGTLLFVQVAKDEPTSRWQEIFNHLALYTP